MDDGQPAASQEEAEVERWRQQAHEAELRATRAEAKIEAQDRYIAQLEGLLIELRRPWWRRWMG